MTVHEIHPLLPAWMSSLEAELSAFFSTDDPLLREACTAVVGTQGKRLRPMLLLLSCASVGSVEARALTYAAMMELIHTTSLAHDDVVDEADERRGMPSAPTRWGNKFSILLGDYLFARVFALAAADGDPIILRMLGEAAVSMGRAVIEELSALSLDADEEIYWRVIGGKTAALYAAATGIGAVLGQATPEQQQALFRMGEAFGYAFQLADDVLDLQGSPAERGKPVGVDFPQRRATLPVLYVYRTATPAVRDDLVALWRTAPFTADHEQTLHAILTAQGGFDYAWQKVNSILMDARGYLDHVPAGPGRNALHALCCERFPLPVMPGAL